MESAVSAFQCMVINQNTHIICSYLSKKSIEMECPQFEIAVLHLTVISDIMQQPYYLLFFSFSCLYW